MRFVLVTWEYLDGTREQHHYDTAAEALRAAESFKGLPIRVWIGAAEVQSGFEREQTFHMEQWRPKTT